MVMGARKWLDEVDTNPQSLAEHLESYDHW